MTPDCKRTRLGTIKDRNWSHERSDRLFNDSTERVSTSRDRIFNAPVHALGCLGRDEPHRSGSCDERRELREKRTVESGFNDDSARCHASLARIHGHCLPEASCCERKICSCEHNRTIAPREFESRCGERLRSAGSDHATNFSRAREDHMIKSVRFQQLHTCLARGRRASQIAIGKIHSCESQQESLRTRRVLGWLHDCRVSSDQ